MDLYPTEDQLQIINSASDYLTRELPAGRMPKQEGTAPPPNQWRGLAAMGWFGIGLSAENGGVGLTVVEEALVLREFGRHLAPPSTVATVLAAHLAAGAGATKLTKALVAGECRAGFAIVKNGEPLSELERFHLLDSDGADLFVIWTPESCRLAPREAFGTVAPIRAIDDSLQACEASGLDPSRVIACDESTAFQHRARVLTAAMLTGGAEATRDLSVEYAKVRQQFDRPIGVFQAISHPCADMATDCEACIAILQYAAVCLRDGSPEAELYSAAAKFTAGAAARKAAMASIQIHGGYGQTYEFLPHFYLKRAHIYQVLGGGIANESAVILDASSTL